MSIQNENEEMNLSAVDNLEVVRKKALGKAMSFYDLYEYYKKQTDEQLENLSKQTLMMILNECENALYNFITEYFNAAEDAVDELKAQHEKDEKAIVEAIKTIEKLVGKR